MLILELLGIYTQDAGSIYPRRWSYMSNKRCKTDLCAVKDVKDDYFYVFPFTSP